MQCIDQNGQTVHITENDEQWLDDAFFRAEMDKLPDDAPRAILLYRVSTKNQVDHDDIPLQKIEGRKFCVQHRWRAVLEKLEKGVSGSKVSAEKRDAIQDIRKAALHHEFDVLVVYMFDRLGRIQNETPFVLEWFVEHGIEVWSTREGQQKIENQTDRLLNYIRFWQAESESHKTQERVKTRIGQLNSSGYFTGGTVPFGYCAVHKGRLNKKDQPVKDLEIDPIEGPIVRELFELTAYQGRSAYRLAQMLNERGVRTHRGTKFQANNILRIIHHKGYMGYIYTKAACSQFIPELQIVGEHLFQLAQRVTEQRCSKIQQAKQVAQRSENPTLLAGMVYCAHCGARLSAFEHKDRYKLADGTVVEKVAPKYNCYQKSQKLRACDGQQLYKAEIVDSIVLQIAREIFEQIRRQPRDRTTEQMLRKQATEKRGERLALEKRLKKAEYILSKYEGEVIKCIEGTSDFSKGMLDRLIKNAEADLANVKKEYKQATENVIDERKELKKLDQYYKDFMGWADEFEMATLERKRMILGQLFTKVEVAKGYKVTVHVNMSYKQFLGLGATQMKEAG